MQHKKNCLFFSLLLLAISSNAQDDLLSAMEDTIPRKQYISNAFKSSRVINAHSIEMIGKGVLDFRILHRFGLLNQGFGELFGLDQAIMRMGFDFGLNKNLSIGIGRTTFKKELDAFIKYRLIQQSSGINSSPFSLLMVLGTAVYTFKSPDPSKPISFNERTGFYFQTIIGKKVNTNFSIQFSPTIVHRNSVGLNDQNDIFAMGMGARYKLSKRVALVVDYSYIANGLPQSVGSNPLSVGVDIETGGHVFQLHFSNAIGMNERSFITETVNKWSKGEVQFGFNLSRVFNIKRKQ